MHSPSPLKLLLGAVTGLVIAAVALTGCPAPATTTGPQPKAGPAARARLLTPVIELNDGPCKPGQPYVQEFLREPMKIRATEGHLSTELVVAIRERCVPVWIPAVDELDKDGNPVKDKDGNPVVKVPAHWTMQTLRLRTYGVPRDPDASITEADANDPVSPKIAWSSPGPTFVVDTATKPGASDGTKINLRLYNRMPFEPEPHACVVNIKCNTKGPNAGVDPATGKCKVPPNSKENGVPPETPHQTVGGQTIEPPNCFHGLNSTNFHFHGFHISPQEHQDNVGLELQPLPPPGTDLSHLGHGSHGARGLVAYGHYDFSIDPLRYTQAPGTHWYHAHKHGSTALHVLNGQVGAFEVRGEFDRKLEAYFEKQGGGALVDRLLVVQQIQEKQPGLGGADQTAAVLVNGQGNPKVTMRRGEIQRWRFVGATMQASAALRIGFPDVSGKLAPRVRQIAMDGVQFSPDNYDCQPFLNNPDCSPPTDNSSFDELSAFNLAPGNRVDILIQAPDTPGVHCLVLDITTKLAEAQKGREQLAARAKLVKGTCGVDTLGPLLTLIVTGESKPMTFPTKADFPALPSFLADLPPVTDPTKQRAIHYEMVDQGVLPGTQFFINQAKYNGDCANESLVVDVPEQWTLWNNSRAISHPFHIHQNPFQLISQSDRGTYKYPVWRDVMPIPTATPPPSAPTDPLYWAPNSNPQDTKQPWGNAVLRYVAKEFTGGFVNHCHILGHEDRGMMHNTQATCKDGKWATTGPVPPGAKCDPSGFCPGDCQLGKPIAASPACPAPPAQQSAWPQAFGIQAN